jgi:hypothetical protein
VLALSRCRSLARTRSPGAQIVSIGDVSFPHHDPWSTTVKTVLKIAAGMLLAGTIAIVGVVAIPASSQAASHAPNVRCMPLDRAERVLHRKHFHVVERGGGFFGIVVKANWVVVNQRQRGNTVVLTGGRSC